MPLGASAATCRAAARLSVVAGHDRRAGPVAGVERIVVASPADRDGRSTRSSLGAAGLLEVEALIVAGGAQAIGALAFGLPEAGIAPVDRIVGPGNAWVTAAKIEVCGEVGIDLPGRAVRRHGPRRRRRRPAPVAADLITQAEHGPDSPAILVTTDAAFADAVEAAGRGPLAAAPSRARHPRAPPSRDHGRIVLAPDLDAAIAFVNAYAPEHLSVDVEPLEPTVARLRNAGSIFVGPWAPESAGDYATGANHVLPTGGLARASGPLAVEAFGKFSQVQRIDREGLAAIRETIATLAEAEGLHAHRDAVEIRFRGDGARPMSPTPVTSTSPTAPATYSWEATDEEVAARYGLDPATIVRFDLNTSPHPAGARRAAPGRPAGSRRRSPNTRRPTTAGSSRRPPRATASTPTSCSSAPARTRSSTSSAKAFLPAGGGAVVPAPTYAMYRVVTEQRGATVVAVPRLGRTRLGAGRRGDPGRRRATPAPPSSGCAARTTRRRSRSRTGDRGAPRGTRRRRRRRRSRAAHRRPRRGLRRVRRVVAARAARRYPNLIVVRTASKAYALAGLRVGFAIARPETIARIDPYRPPGSVSTV